MGKLSDNYLENYPLPVSFRSYFTFYCRFLISRVIFVLLSPHQLGIKGNLLWDLSGGNIARVGGTGDCELLFKYLTLCPTPGLRPSPNFGYFGEGGPGLRPRPNFGFLGRGAGGPGFAGHPLPYFRPPPPRVAEPLLLYWEAPNAHPGPPMPRSGPPPFPPLLVPLALPRASLRTPPPPPTLGPLMPHPGPPMPHPEFPHAPP